MKPLHDKKHTLAKRGLSLLCVLALCLGLLPVTALAEGEDAPATLYVGQTQITAGYWITDANGKLAASDENNYNVYYDGSGTLTLKDATIQGRGIINEGDPIDYGIYAASTSGQSVALTINLIGSNTVNGYGGICVEAQNGGNATLVIQSDTNGSLATSGSGWNGITISSDSGNASLTINNASVVANSKKQSSHGVSIKSSSSTELSLTVNGGSLTATGTYGIFYSSLSGMNPSTSLTVRDSALIKAIPSIYASVASIPTPKADSESGGIVFNGNSGTVYGSVTLQDDLTIDQDETLTIPEGSSLTSNDKLTNNGTVTIENGGTLTDADKVTNNGTINVEDGGSITGEPTGGSGTVVKAPTITTQSENQTVTVGQTASFTVTATGENLSYQWQQSTDSGQNWTNIGDATDATYTEEATTTSMNGYQYRCVVSNSAGSVTSEVATLTVTEPTTYTITANVAPAGAGTVTVNGSGTSATVTANSDVTLTATANDGYRFTGWMENDRQVSTDATYTFKATGDRTLTAKFEKKVTGVTLNTETLELFTGDNATLTATVEPGNATNKNVTWSSDNEAVATVDQNGTVTAVGAGKTTISVTTEDGGKTATCTVTVTDKTYAISADTTALNFGSAYTGYAQPAAQTVTVKNTGNQTVTLNPPTANNFEITTSDSLTLAPNAIATFTIQPKDKLPRGSYSEQITITGDNNVSETLTATFTVKEPPYTGKYSYELTTSVGDHGSLSVDRYATEGDKVTITVTPDEAYLLDDLTVTAHGKDVELTANDDGTFSFTMPSADVKISATFAEDPDWTEPEEPATDVSDIFLDVAPNAWYKDAIQYAYDNGLMTGVSATEFAPEATTTRAMIVSILARLEGVTTAQAAGFADVDDEWYATAVNWAANVGVVNGYEDGTFKPNTAITREQLAAILMNYAAYKGEDVSNRADLTSYTDQPSTWATETMSWAVAEGLINGVTNDQLQPQGNATRAQVAAILQRLLEA